MSLKLVFMGTPDFAVPALDAVAAAGHQIVAVYCQPPRPAGRGMAPAKSQVQRRAESLGFTVVTPLNFRGEAERAAFAALEADAAVVVAYGLILPKAVLDAPRLGCFNIHASRLPRWRGAAPIQRAIMAGDTSTAVAIMRMETGLDTGAVCLTRDIAISSDTNAGALHDALASAGSELIVEALARLEAGTIAETPQSSDGVTYAAKIDKAELRIDFARPAADVVNHVRALAPQPGAWFEVKIEGGRTERIKAIEAEAADGAATPGTVLDGELTIACGSRAVRLRRVQRAGKTAVSSAEFLRGFHLEPGAVVG
ncbi:MAG: methionyl-tRNA formyltransferase [Hyphomicrobium sp.]